MATRYYYWLVTQDPETNKPYLIYGGTTEEEARDKGLEILAGLDFNIKRLPTRNINAASAMIRGTRLEKSHDIRKAGERQGHDRSLRRLKRRYKTRHLFQ